MKKINIMVYKTLVFSGGGTRCLVLAELLVLLERDGHLLETTKYYGTSAGALLAALYALCRDAYRTKTILWALDFASFRNIDVANLLNFMSTWALDDGIALQTSIDNLFEQACCGGSSLLLRDVPSLHICVADLTIRKTLILSADNYPTMRVATAVRVSMTLPIFIKPFISQEGHLWVDGGVRANFPWFCVHEALRAEALGLCFARNNFESPQNLGEYILSMIHFDESMEEKVPYSDKNIICSAVPPFPAWFLRLRNSDYELIIRLAHAAYEDWKARLIKTVPQDDSTHPQENCGIPQPSALLHTSSPTCLLRYTAPPLDIPRVSPAPSRDSFPHLPPHKSQIVRRWSF
jgi:predicted patatin/cPLA2 family phospholipase